MRFGALNDTQRGALVQEFSDTANAVKEDNYMPVILYRDGKEVWRHDGEIEGNALLKTIEGAMA